MSKTSWLSRLRGIGTNLADDVDGVLEAIRDALTKFAIRGFELEVVGRVLKEAAEIGSRGRFPLYRVYVLAGYTSEPIASALRVALLREGFLGEVVEAPFSAFRESIIDSASPLYQQEYDAVVLALGYRNLRPDPTQLSFDAAPETIMSEWLNEMRDLWAHLGARLKVPLFQHTIEPTGLHYIGAGRLRHGADPDRLLSALQERMYEAAPAFVHWVDTSGLAQRVGLSRWHDPRFYFHGAFGFNREFLPEYSAVLGGAFRASLGATKKCLILDLDNTLWGGVVGDDGVDHVRVGPDDPESRAYQEFCRYVLALKDRGVILAVCSKNEEKTARAVFDRRADMPLKMDDFSAFVCNWEDKARNVELIARTLNLGLAHLAFVDDNPAECARVAEVNAGLGVLCLPEDPAGRVAALERQHWFDTIQLSSEDRLRSDSYQGLRRAEEVRSSARNIAEYLAGLEMTASLYEATSADSLRLAQMEAKTNQFNLRTRRFSEEEVLAFIDSQDRYVLACRLADRFADHGVVASIVLRRAGATLEIENWVMSCRVFSRTLEHFMLRELMSLARSMGVERLVADFVPTSKNAVISDLLANLGFTRAGEDSEGQWVLDVGDRYEGQPTYIAAGPDAFG